MPGGRVVLVLFQSPCPTSSVPGPLMALKGHAVLPWLSGREMVTVRGVPLGACEPRDAVEW